METWIEEGTNRIGWRRMAAAALDSRAQYDLVSYIFWLSTHIQMVKSLSTSGQ